MKTKAILFTLLTGILLAVLNSCNLVVIAGIRGNGDVICQERAASDFHGVILDGVGDVKIHFAEDYRVTVTTDSNIQDIVTIKSHGNNLHIGTSENAWFNTTKLAIDVYLPELRGLELKGAGNIGVTGGEVSDLKMELSGVGNIDAQSFEVENVNITLSGVGDIKTWATKNLTGKISGVGDIFYKGNPVINVNTNITGAIRKL